MDDNVEIIRSNKGGMKVIHRGYMYTVHKKRQSGGIRWRCTQRSLHCKGSISTGNGPPRVNMPHNHIPDPHSVAIARCRQFEEFGDISSLVEMDYDDDVTDSMPLQQRLALSTRSSPQIQIPKTPETPLKSQPLSPTKLKVTRQSQAAQQKQPEQVKPEPVEEEVCLRWNSHHSNMQTAFPALLQKEQYVDVTLIAEGKTLKCHKLILCSCSSYFDEILSAITPLQHPVIFMNNIPFWILKSLCDFMYAGEVHIDQSKLEELLQVAEILKIKGLARKSNIPQPEPSPTPSAPSPKPKQKPEKPEPTPPKTVPPKAAPPKPAPPKPAPKSQPKFVVLSRQQQAKLTSNIAPVDPLQLLQPAAFTERRSESPQARIKEIKTYSKKGVVKKLRKRKSSEMDNPPPITQFRKGTRTRPHVKVPKYYHNDYDDIIKPSPLPRQEDPIIPSEKIKAEPIDFVDNDLNYDAETDDVTGNGNVNEHEEVPEEDEDDDEDKGDFLKITLMQKDTNSEKFAVLEIEDRVDVDDSEEIKSPEKLGRTNSENIEEKAKKIALEEEEETEDLEEELEDESEVKRVIEEKDLPMPVLSPIEGIQAVVEEKDDETLKDASKAESDCKNEENK